MAGHHRFTLVLDACVLYPITVADALISLAYEDIFAAKWTTLIEGEWLRSLMKQRPDLPEQKLRARLFSMRKAIHDWEVDANATLQIARSLELPDKDDRHVLAAAIVGHADAIVTCNLDDFPSHFLEPYDIVALHPDEFIVNQLDLDGFKALGALKAMRGRSKSPPRSVDEFIALFRHNRLVLTADRLQSAADAGLI